ncbi:MAG: glycosyltransferase [Clostridiales bacterium]|nr:glycosyltransferase [Clostridiales bacterium]
MKNVNYAKRGYHYMKNYGMTRLRRKAQERLRRNLLEKGYQEWMISARPAMSELELQRAHRFAYQPKISVVVPVYRTQEIFLREMIESVLGQTYGNLELCLADGSGEDCSVQRIVQGYAERDERVCYRKLAENLGISGNTNEAVSMASGDYLALLDHDDLLEEHALFEIVRWLQNNRDADMIYTDEDKVTFDSATFFQPHFKPDFNLDLLRSNNYICHLLVVSRDLIKKAGGYSSEYDGAQDFDFILRCSEHASKIGHIPKVLYHWRSHKASTATNPESKMYAYEAGRRAVEQHLARQGIAASVGMMDNPGFYRISYVPSGMPKISIILLDVPKLKVLERFLKAIERNRTYTNLEILVLLDGDEKNKLILNFIKQHRQIPIKVVYCMSACNKFVTFSRLAEKLDSEYLLFLESRIEKISRGWAEMFLGNAQRSEAGAVGGRVYDNNRRLRYGARILGLGGLAGDAFEGLKLGYTGYFHKAVLQQNFHAVSGKAMMVKRESFLMAGGFSEEVEDRMKDVDLCLKLEKLGLKNIYDPGVILVEQKHTGHRKKGTRTAPVFEKKWKTLLQEPDGYYNRNLSLEDTDWRIRE